MNFKEFKGLFYERTFINACTQDEYDFLFNFFFCVSRVVNAAPWYRKNRIFKKYRNYKEVMKMVNDIQRRIYGFNDGNCKKLGG